MQHFRIILRKKSNNMMMKQNIYVIL